MTSAAYIANVEMKRPQDEQAECDSCGWRGLVDQTTDIEETVLCAGDPSPVGRCPKCDALAYVETVPGKKLSAAARAQNVEIACAHLREARKLLAAAGARQTLKRVRLALKSAEGARRHARARESGQYYRQRRLEGTA